MPLFCAATNILSSAALPCSPLSPQLSMTLPMRQRRWSHRREQTRHFEHLARDVLQRLTAQARLLRQRRHCVAGRLRLGGDGSEDLLKILVESASASPVAPVLATKPSETSSKVSPASSDALPMATRPAVPAPIASAPIAFILPVILARPLLALSIRPITISRPALVATLSPRACVAPAPPRASGGHARHECRSTVPRHNRDR